MNKNLVFADYIVFAIYFVLVASYGYWIYQRKKKAVTDTKDFFLGGRLPDLVAQSALR